MPGWRTVRQQRGYGGTPPLLEHEGPAPTRGGRAGEGLRATLRPGVGGGLTPGLTERHGLAGIGSVPGGVVHALAHGALPVSALHAGWLAEDTTPCSMGMRVALGDPPGGAW